MNPVLKSNFDNSAIVINQSPFSIGRAIDNTHVITNVSISRHHCIFTKSEDNKWRLKDTSSNGTQVNGKLLKNCESEDLKNGDVIVLSTTTGYSYIFEDTTNPIIVLDDSDIIKLETTASDEHLCHVADSLLEVVVESTLINNSNEQSNAQPPPNSNPLVESTEDELTCAICSEIFIKTVTLQCSHSFCEYCVEMWKKNKPTCPICRTRIVTITPTLTIDNLINKLLDNLPQDRKEQRNKTIEQRQTVDKPSPSTSSEVVISSEEEPDDDSMEESFDEDMDEDYDYESHYYGVYGRCYSCGRRGHWANRCPFRYS